MLESEKLTHRKLSPHLFIRKIVQKMEVHRLPFTNWLAVSLLRNLDRDDFSPLTADGDHSRPLVHFIQDQNSIRLTHCVQTVSNG